jgi:hypothetical protein
MTESEPLVPANFMRYLLARAPMIRYILPQTYRVVMIRKHSKEFTTLIDARARS